MKYVAGEAVQHFQEKGVFRRTEAAIKTYFVQSMMKRYREVCSIAHQSGEGALLSDSGSTGKKQFEGNNSN